MHYATIEPKTLDLLKKLMQTPEISNFRLVGGTSLALQLGHRISIDIDLFGQTETPLDEILSKLELLGHVDRNQTRTSGETILQTNIDDIKVDIVKYHYPWIRDFIFEDSIRLATFEDISAMKVAAIGSRGSRKDFFDLYFLLKIFSMQQIIEFFQEKFSILNTFHYLQSLTYFEDAERDLDPHMLQKVSWEEVKKTIQDHVRNFEL